MDSRILLTLTLVIEEIKVFSVSGTSLFCKDQTAPVLIEIITDFLYRLKDRLPFGTFFYLNKLGSFKVYWKMEVFNTIMEFLIPNGYLPSAALLKEYSKSKVTKKLNTLPTRKYINSKFCEYRQISKGTYEHLRNRFYSRPPFVFYFNPNSEIKENVQSFNLGLVMADVLIREVSV